jgi:glucosamine-phosphate N-acetyltransferase
MEDFFLFQAHNAGYLFDSELLKNLDWASVRGYLSPPITNEAPGEPWLHVRPLQIEDYDKGYLQILTQLTAVGNVSRPDFERKWSVLCIFYCKERNV